MTDAGAFVRAFAEGWAGPHPERLLDPLDRDVRLLQPLFPPSTGRDAARATFFRPLLRFLPDLRLAVDRWSAADDTVLIEWTAVATLGGRALPLVVAVVRRPSCWAGFLRSGMARHWRRLLRGVS